MGFMRPVIYQGDYFLIETTHGTEFIPGDVLGEFPGAPEIGQTLDRDDDTNERWSWIIKAVRDYIEGNHIESIERRTGYYGRYSAPGYTDCTDWHWGDSEASVLVELNDMYGDADTESDDDNTEA
jgi:hypothetical protein